VLCFRGSGLFFAAWLGMVYSHERLGTIKSPDETSPLLSVCFVCSLSLSLAFPIFLRLYIRPT
jgi:hypothetical protein